MLAATVDGDEGVTMGDDELSPPPLAGPVIGDATVTTWPSSTVQTCWVHLIRAAMRFDSLQRSHRICF